MLRSRSFLALVGWAVSVSAATEVVYVTDLSIFTFLAPCAQAAVSGVIDYETNSNCPSGASALQSCICSKNDGRNRASISGSISDSIDYSIFKLTFSAHASSVLAGYCNQATITPFPEPSFTVADYIVDLSAYHNLAPCAQSGVSAVVLGMTWDRCQEDASLLATCACQKNMNSAWASDQINESVKFYCDSHTADIGSAQQIFSGYCGLVEGTTSFPETTDPPGNVDYYITALKEFKALAPCAQTAVSYNVLQQTSDLCPSGPKALASCACLRSEMTGAISSLITSDARYYCSSAADDISSALDVWNIYCSAAKGLTTPAGITETISEANSPSQTRTSSAHKTTQGGSGNTTSNTTTSENIMSNTGVIAGAVVGAVGGTALIAAVAFLLYRRKKKAQQAAATAPSGLDDVKPELDSTSIPPRPTGSPSPSMMKNRMDDISPVSAVSSPYAPPPMPELHNQAPPTPELHGREAQFQQRTAHEAYSQQVYEAPGQTRPMVSRAHGQPVSAVGWQSGPVPHAYEMDGVGEILLTPGRRLGFSPDLVKTIGLIFVGIFVLIRRRFPLLYAPRTFLGTVPEKDQTPSAGKARFDWLRTMRKLPDEFLLYHESLDAMWSHMACSDAGECDGGRVIHELDRITISNVMKTNHLYAHAVIAWVFCGFVMFTIARERLWLIGIRQAWTLSTPNAKRVSSRTVLFLSAPRDALEQSNINRYFGNGAIRIWPVTKLEALQTLVSERSALVEKLESEEAFLIHKANSWSIHLVKMGLRLRSKLITSPFGPRFGFFNRKKVDTIQLLRDQIKEKGELIEEMRRSHDIGEPYDTMSGLTAQYPMLSRDRLIHTLRGYFPKLGVPSIGSKGAAIFVEFKTQTEAQHACQQVASSDPLALMPRYAGVKPSEIIWDNLTIPPLKRLFQEGIALAIIILIIVFWSVPSSLVGIVSNISYLAENFESLGFLNNLPGPVLGLLSGLLPPLLTSYLSKDVLMINHRRLDIFMTFGGPIETINELKVQKWGYVFQVTQVFLVTAVFSGAATVASQLADVRAIPALLATQLPKSSNYYLTYFIVQGITSAADNLLDYSNVLDYLSVEYLINETPRQKFNRYTKMKGIAWGEVFPKFTNFAIIAIAYSCIAPLVLGFAAAGLSLYYLSYRYNLFYVMQPKIDTKGQAYTLALRHLLTGVYIAELVLIGFFGLRKAKGPSIMTGVLFIVTVLYSVLINKYLSPLEKLLPTDLTSSEERDDETTPLLSSVEEGRGSRSVADKPTAQFLNPRASASYNFMKSWVRGGKDYDMEEHDVPEYTKEELERAYLHPALTAPAPLIWMARDPMGASKNEVQETEECGLKASDEGAWLDESRIVRWNVHEFEKVPVWKKVVKY
ncbi:hypothetical protein E0Z10_g9261 [Xylaria hypoxylon]|uniref:CSC1/OSCA1-like 7TM region domain-containing protein n=1 Tax=Xylaria hypoxylon TaxID=37992 RepID=A0A4Z0Y986_9PEZI|nr:hypothetical protein E0Z10_g9261 [Xylaria hypoxylon]